MIMQILAEKIADTLASLHFPWKERVTSSGTFMFLEKFDLIWPKRTNNLIMAMGVSASFTFQLDNTKS